MARHQIVVYKDDLDGTEEGVRPVKFGFDGVSYEIDLAPANHAKLKEILQPYIEAGTKVSGRAAATPRIAPARRAAAAAEQKEFNARVREWAPGAGHKVKPRGRVPEKVIEAYLKSGGK
ncbi:histone-like nucleoid-structuring protein Lsr2 [Hamadaea tsunoensis]|uniref:histone-like nucleoid-structuring protein Lsr2 n=1 Tax=Hamadaea tsunoensis TaxID=53368 RepID=UPI0003F7DF36|nr:Lsr2 family protein [Hamadaea tsunoensis]